MEKGMSCPVCTLYLREGITLEEHLKTHPKDQVISALLKAVSSNKETTQTTSQVAVNVTPQLPRLFPLQQRPVQHLLQPQTQMTTAVTYQQYVTSNGTSIVPQYIQVPTIVAPSNNSLSMQSLQYIPSGFQYNTLYNSFIPQPYTLPVINNSYPAQVSVIAAPAVPKPSVTQETTTTTTTCELAEDVEESNYVEREVSTSKQSVITRVKQVNWSRNDEPNPGDPLDVEEEYYELTTENDAKVEQEQPVVFYKDENVEQESVVAENNAQVKDVDEIDSSVVENGNTIMYTVEECCNKSEDDYQVDIDRGDDEQIDEYADEITYNTQDNRMKMSVRQDKIDEDDDYYYPKSDNIEAVTNKDEHSESEYNEPVLFTDLQPVKNLNFQFHYNDHNYIEVESLRILLANEDGQHQSQSCLNIEADETMPAKGELSEQESLGADNSNWAMAYQNEIVNTKPTSSIHVKTTPNKRLFKCSLCDLKFSCPKERRVHKNAVHCVNLADSSKKKKFYCYSCGKLFDSMKSRRQHMINENHSPSSTFTLSEHTSNIRIESLVTEKKLNKTDCGVSTVKEENIVIKHEVKEVQELICAKCKLVEPSLKDLLEHLRTKHDEPKYQCSNCSQSFSTEKDYNEHLKIHPLNCDKCNKVFYKKQNLKLHMRRHLKEKPFKCTMCTKSFVTRQKLEEHINGHVGNKPLKCPVCDYRSSRYSNLVQHKKLHHLRLKKKAKDFVCRCGEVFHSRRKLEWHKEVHEAKPKTCPHCTQKFVHSSSLTRHIRRSHAPGYLPDETRKVENVQCPICFKVYIQTSLLVHMRVHNGTKPFPCKICNKKFTTKWNLQLHSWTHQSRSNMPFKCIQCKSAFFRHSDYVIHLNAHKNFKPFSCNICGQKFIRKYNCLRHQFEHKSKKKFFCTVGDCGKSFHRSYYLKDHLKVHTGVRPYSCHVCGKASSTKSNHNKHVKIHDTREPVNTEN